MLRPAFLSVLAFLLLGLPWASPAMAVVPATVGIEGRLSNAAGGAIADGVYAVTFRLYAAADATQVSWTESVAGIAVQSGAWTHALGSVVPLTPQLLDDGTAGWLGVQIGGDPELPRVKIRSAPFALRALLAEGIVCSGCVTMGMLEPATLAQFVKVSDLNAYAQVKDLQSVATTGAYTDLKGLPQLPQVGTSCGTGLLVRGISADGNLDCAAAVAGGKCEPGQVVTAVQADGSVACKPVQVPGGQCQAGSVVTEVKTDGSVTCGELAGPIANAIPCLSCANGVLDLGPTKGDELTSAALKTLVAGGNADALHTHAGMGGSIKFKGVTSVAFAANVKTSERNKQCALEFGAARNCDVRNIVDSYPAPEPTAKAWVLDYEPSFYGQARARQEVPWVSSNTCSGQTVPQQKGVALDVDGSLVNVSCDQVLPAACCGP